MSIASQVFGSSRERIGAGREALLDSLVGVTADALDSLTPEERHHVYKILKPETALLCVNLKLHGYPVLTLHINFSYDSTPYSPTARERCASSG